MFQSENDMQKKLQEFLLSKLSNDEILIKSEISGLFGVPDIVLAESTEGTINHVIALELKLNSWKKAIEQAFKYRSFSWESYVVMDAHKESVAKANIDMFKKYNIGLATYSIFDEFKVLYKPRIARPYSTGLFLKLCSLFSNNSINQAAIKSRPNRNMGLGQAFQSVQNCGFA